MISECCDGEHEGKPCLCVGCEYNLKSYNEDRCGCYMCTGPVTECRKGDMDED